ncbi:hypothetical protein PHLH3_55490 [Pseudomonas sp. St386]|uniref:hypothetical protein n=1 Tax=Pseudomonas TaxID=286 RepID=UPI000579131F|nr:MULTISPECIES: hypothetical protein [Pseudomonas]PJH90534.1 hypothetical protein CVG87_00515 [Pseudomonas sp. WCS365]UII14801.1 hypothetical protein LRP86_01691 [Pseudomonas brassicacearum]BBP55923.1 hypothetical protein PHLH3_55490 [Pseudomonas sp. St386]
MGIFMTGGSGILLLIIGHVHAEEVTHPSAAPSHGNNETVEIQDDREWQQPRLIQAANPAVEQLNEAEFAIHESDEEEQALSRVTLTCNVGGIHLTLHYLQAQAPTPDCFSLSF